MSLDIWLEVNVGGNENVMLDDYDWNITHNVAAMWRLAGCYERLYESRGDKAGWHIDGLRSAYTKMRDNPDEYKALNPSNGWGNYDGALKWLNTVIKGFEEAPEALIGVSA